MSQQSYQKHTPAQWQRFIDQQAESGQSQPEFCAAHGLARSTFQHWKRRLKYAAVPEHAPSPPEALFAPLIEPSVSPTLEADSAPGAGWELELELGGGMCLRLRRTP